MNTYAIAFIIITGIALILLPRRLAPLPLLVGSCYIIRSQVFALGPFHFSVIRLLVAVGVIRIISKGERLEGKLNAIDWLMVLWSVCMLISSSFHNDPSAALVYRLGLVYDSCGIYFLIRVLCQSFNDVFTICRLTALLLLPIAAEMIYEQLTVTNLFSLLGDGSISPAIRDNKIRARGPFAHAILGGTIGAVNMPLIIGLWQVHRKSALLGMIACLIIVFTSNSSGPILSLMFAISGLLMWHYRTQMRLVRWLAIMAYIALNIVMKDPAYFIIARIDLTGSSTGWHRARLIQSAIQHLSEWWLAGTDYTRHWMPTGVSWSMDHTDITNQYLQMGVIGGLPLMLLYIAVITKGFSLVGRALREIQDLSPQNQFMCWAMGSTLFAHATTFISVAYFDQSFVFINLILAMIGSVWSCVSKKVTPE